MKSICEILRVWGKAVALLRYQSNQYFTPRADDSAHRLGVNLGDKTQVSV